MLRPLLILSCLLSPLYGQDGLDRIRQAINHPDRFEEDIRRDPFSMPLKTMSYFQLEEGMSAIDICAAGGYNAELIARVVGPNGKVYLHNNRAWIAYVEKRIERRIANGRLPNIIRHDRELAKLDIPDESLDLILMDMVYHDLYYVSQGWPKVDVAQFMSQIYKMLKPGGVLVIIDHAAKEGSGLEPAQELHRIDPLFTKKNVVAHGFQFEVEGKHFANPEDTRELNVFHQDIQRQTDRFLFRFRKPRQ